MTKFSTQQADVAIIGGGMVGVALALMMAKSLPQRRITIIETFPMPEVSSKNPVPTYQPSFDDRSTAIAHGSVQLLQTMGVWSSLQQHGTAIKKVHVSDRGHVSGTLIDCADVGVMALGYVVPNAWIGRVLLSDLQAHSNIQVLAPASVTNLQPVAGGAVLSAVLENGEPLQLFTQLAVIADGAQSPLRQSLGMTATTEDYEQTAIVANIGLDRSHNHVAYERFTEAGPMAMLPLAGSETDSSHELSDGKTSALVWTHPKAEAQAIMGMSDKEFLALLQQRFGHRLGVFTSVSKRDAYPLALTLAQEQVRSSIVVMGNAAHFLHPVAGQGFNLALRDCAALVNVLAKAKHDGHVGALSLLQQYLASQQSDQDMTVLVSDQLSKWFSTSRLSAAALRSLGFVGLEMLPPAKQWFTRQTMGSASKTLHLPF